MFVDHTYGNYLKKSFKLAEVPKRKRRIITADLDLNHLFPNNNSPDDVEERNEKFSQLSQHTEKQRQLIKEHDLKFKRDRRLRALSDRLEQAKLLEKKKNYESHLRRMVNNKTPRYRSSTPYWDLKHKRSPRPSSRKGVFLLTSVNPITPLTPILKNANRLPNKENLMTEFPYISHSKESQHS